MTQRDVPGNLTEVHRGSKVTLRGLASLVVANLRLYVREPIGAFFTLAFPVMLVLIFGAIYGNEPQDMFNGRGSMDISMPAYTALILGSVGLLGVAINTSSYRVAGILRRFRMTPLRPLVYIAADVTANLIMTLAGMAGVIVMGWLSVPGAVRGPGSECVPRRHPVRNRHVRSGLSDRRTGTECQAAQVIGMAVLYPMLFLSGAGIPLEVMPDSVRTISDYLPLTYVVRLLRGLWFGEPWGSLLLETGVLVGVLLICTAIAVRLFRWE